jgi:hypothetical protein
LSSSPKQKQTLRTYCDQTSNHNGFEEEDSDEDEKRSDQGYGFSGFLDLASRMVERGSKNSHA